MRHIGAGLIIAIGFVITGTAWGAEGADLYAKKCVACHGAKGEGAPIGPALKGNPFVTKGKPEEIKQVILQGRAGTARKHPNFAAGMPPGLATAPEAEALTKFLQVDLQK